MQKPHKFAVRCTNLIKINDMEFFSYLENGTHLSSYVIGITANGKSN